jgi:hypothetical protein
MTPRLGGPVATNLHDHVSYDPIAVAPSLRAASLPPTPGPSTDSSSKTSPLLPILAAGIGGAALVLAIIALVLTVRKKGPREAGYTAEIVTKLLDGMS